MELVLGGGRKPNQPNEITPQEFLGIEAEEEIWQGWQGCWFPLQ